MRPGDGDKAGRRLNPPGVFFPMGIPFKAMAHESCWRVGADGAVLVWCSKGHASRVMHGIRLDGTLYAPAGFKPSMHCGHCNEDLLLKLDDWVGGERQPG